MEGSEITKSQLLNKQKAQFNSFLSFRQEEEYWRLKSHSLWFQARYINTTFFHRKCRACLSQNHISKISNRERGVIKGQSLIKYVATTHYQNLFQEDHSSDDDLVADFLSNIPSLVTADVNVRLVKPFSEKEIVEFIWSMQLDKAPGPDGFTIHFYKACWNVIKLNLLIMVKSFQKKAKVEGCTNSTFLALIPKDINPKTFDRFQLISLCNASYKILAKLLANRLKSFLGNLISPLQGGFVKGRHLIDNVIQVQEALHSSHSWQEKGMLIKLDMSNSFDQVKLSFLYKILLSFGFSVDFVNLIKAFTHRPWIVPLVNGRPSDFFQASRGLCQGCPLSPFLYILLA